MSSQAFNIVILGAGSGGLSLASRLKRELPSASVAIVDPSDTHYFQPFWTLAGAGLIDKFSTEKPMGEVIPKDLHWIQDRVVKVEPKANLVHLADGKSLRYEFLVVATGLRLAWEKIEGLPDSLGSNGICSIYDFKQLDYTSRTLNSYQGGRSLFTMPPTPVKCAGAPQKIMYLAEEIFRKKKLYGEIHFMTAGKSMFSVPVFAEALYKLAKNKGIHCNFAHRLIAVDGPKHEATFATNGEIKKFYFDLLHVVPPMAAHSYIAESELGVNEGEQKGFLAVDKFTLRHLQFDNIVGLGDVTGIPNSKTVAAIGHQIPVVVEALKCAFLGLSPKKKYDGYAACPIITELGKVMLAEFGYEGKLLPTLPLNPAVPRKSMWLYYRYAFPKMYWNLLIRGRALGGMVPPRRVAEIGNSSHEAK